MKKTVFFLLLFYSLFAQSQNSILWKVTTPNSKNTSYLLGTNHIFGESFIDSFPVIKEKLQLSDLIITELKLDWIKISEYYNSRQGSDTLLTLLSKEDVDFITVILKRRKRSVDITKFSPGELFLKLQAFYSAFKCDIINKKDSSSMDEYIQYLAMQQQKRQYYFETDSFQAAALAEASKKIDWKFFKKNAPVLLNRYRTEKPDENLCSMNNQYAAMSMDYKFGEDCNLIKNASANDILIKKRNEDWIIKLSALLPQNNCFIAAGIGHFYNKCGLIEQLRTLGYTVEPVPLK